ncbi:amino acid ABC transporter permease [Desulfovibrio subterraneus]|jgi:glutamine transport system permease protein|uniref:Putative glutamine transport system permease protein GlnP n=1 Tax=Desulfovibrio subterraneus TaxID=2718620 RepID=A0A7J0BHB5_9BACT|nr:amino acid ABC transporter permease [Desulfovibrio subterraneus]GFM32592.1 glutamine ABC transporter permease [Desulfovibrio subterraneus]
MAFQFKSDVMWETLPLLTEGIELTIYLTVVGLIFGFIIGVTTGIARISRNPVLRYTSLAYIEIIRGTPMVVQALFLYFGLPLATGMRIAPVTAGIITIAVNSGAYIAEIVRGAIESIDVGQSEAGRSIGLTRMQTMLYVIWPQAFKRMIPPLGNQFIISLKDTSLLTVIGVAELTRQGQEIVAVNFRSFEVYLTIAVVYLCMTMSIAKALRMYERKLFNRSRR